MSDMPERIWACPKFEYMMGQGQPDWYNGTMTTRERPEYTEYVPADKLRWIPVTEPPKESGSYFVIFATRKRAEYYYSRVHGWGRPASAITHWWDPSVLTTGDE